MVTFMRQGSGASARHADRSALVNVAPVALAVTLGYALAVSLLDRDDPSGGVRAVAIVVATAALGMAMRDPGGLVRTLGRGLQSLSCKRIALGALAVRLVWVLASNVTQTSDFAHYDRMAREISGGLYLVNPTLPTGPSILFALHYVMFGYTPLAPQLTLVLLSTAQVLLVYSLLLKTTASRPAALLGATILAVWPEHILYVNLLGSDVLFSTLVLLAAWMLTRSSGSRPRWDVAAVVAAGVVLGCSHWVRNTAFAFLLASLLFLALHDGWRFKRRAAAVGALVAGFLLPVLPLVYLNYLAIGFPSPTASQIGGWSLFVGANSASLGRWNKQDEVLIDGLVAARVPSREHPFVVRDRIAREMALQRIREHPGAYAWTMFRHKVSLLWARAAEISWPVRTSRLGAREPWVWVAVNVFHALAAVAAVVGLMSAAVRRQYAWDARQILFWAALLTTAVHCVMEVQPRYHHMFLPTLAIAIGQMMLAPIRQEDPPPRPARRA